MVDIDRHTTEICSTTLPRGGYAAYQQPARDIRSVVASSLDQPRLKNLRLMGPADASAMIAKEFRLLPAPWRARPQARISARCWRPGRVQPTRRSRSSSVGTGSPTNNGSNQAPASKRRIAAKVSSRAWPRPFVVRSSRSSCRRINSPSAVKRTSNSTHLQPRAWARRSPTRVFSGASPAAPRCPITGGSQGPVPFELWLSNRCIAAASIKNRRAVFKYGRDRSVRLSYFTTSGVRTGSARLLPTSSPVC